MPADTIVGYLIVGAGILFALGLVFAITSRQTAASARPHPPHGVHLPNPSLLPFVLSIGAALLGAGLALHALSAVLYVLAAVGVLVIAYAAVGWVRAAGREWRETESTPHDEAEGH
jgi:threonine/homoserine/homoserine lactone efflux protein